MRRLGQAIVGLAKLAWAFIRGEPWNSENRAAAAPAMGEFDARDVEQRLAVKHDFRVYQGCAVPKNIAPYIAIVCDDAHAEVDSIYRGDDARQILNRHGKHTQFQLYHATPAQRRAWGVLGQPNKPGRSTHEQFSDAVAYAGPVGRSLAWWEIGFDVDAAAAGRVIAQARRHGWDLFRPYSSGAELHHLNFRKQPRPGPRTAARIIRLRRTLKRR